MALLLFSLENDSRKSGAISVMATLRMDVRFCFEVSGKVYNRANRRLAFPCQHGTKKTGEPAISTARPSRLEASHVRSLQTLGALGDLELNRLTFVERLVSIRHDCREMDKDVFAGLALNEAKTLASIEPLYCSLFFHLCFLFFYNKAIWCVPTASSRKLKKPQVLPRSPLKSNLKVIQEQQTQLDTSTFSP
jgi:hypothetical protein